jgi:hypothetical protein
MMNKIKYLFLVAMATATIVAMSLPAMARTGNGW